MITQSTDTHPDVERKLISLIRESSIADRFGRLCSMTETVINLSRRAIRRANPDLDAREQNFLFIAYHYGEDIADRLRRYMDARAL